MRTVLVSATLAAAVLFASGPAAFAAGTGSEGYFIVHNDTSNNVLSGFYTDDGTGWSANWLDDTLEPGEAIEMEFVAAEGSCAQEFMAGWVGQDGGEVRDEPHSIDVCDASNVYLLDQGVEYD